MAQINIQNLVRKGYTVVEVRIVRPGEDPPQGVPVESLADGYKVAFIPIKEVGHETHTEARVIPQVA